MTSKQGENQRHRRSIRLRGYDYASPGAYFVTICAQGRACVFGAVRDGAMVCNDVGSAVTDAWNALPRHYGNVALDAFVVMPNHVHGIIVIRRGDACVAPTTGVRRRRGPARGSVGAIVGSVKSAAARRINEIRATPGKTVWQRNYHEHIIRDDGEMGRIRQYIADNPARWTDDPDNPGRIAPATDAAHVPSAHVGATPCGRLAPPRGGRDVRDVRDSAQAQGPAPAVVASMPDRARLPADGGAAHASPLQIRRGAR